MARDQDCCGGTWMRFKNRFLAAFIVPALMISPALAQESATFGQSLAEGPMTAWCEPGQALLSGGYELKGAEPVAPEPAPETAPEEGVPPAEPVIFVSASHPTLRLDGSGNVAQFGWTAVPNTIVGAAGPLVA